jgi:hypothetical protein
VPKLGAQAVAPLWRALLGARAAAVNGSGAGANGGADHDHELERYVDVHAFVPDELAALAHDAGLRDVHVRGEELLANLFGWFNRGVEATAEPEDVPWAWRQYAYRGYLALQHVDHRLLESRLPAGVFYNLMLTARKPE